MAFNGTEGGQISLEAGAAMTAAHRKLNPNETRAHFFGKDILNDLLGQTGCVGIRMYYGIDSDGMRQLVLVGVDAEGKDKTELVADMSIRCPTQCDPSSALNG